MAQEKITCKRVQNWKYLSIIIFENYMYPICCKKDNLLDIIDLNIVIVPKDKESLAKAECQRKKILVIISLFVKDEIVSHITRMNSFTLMWQTLKELFKHRSDVQHLLLATILTTLWLQEGGSIVEYFKQLKDFMN
jgi:hypothetical protein